MDLPRIQYITHPKENFDDLSWVHRLHENGVSWIQLRIKEDDFIKTNPSKHYLAHFHETADKMRAITLALNMVLTINDSEEVARFSNADGLHVGQEDDLEILRSFPENSIKGGTANSFEEMQQFDRGIMSYFGVGPLRFTSTKEKLKPVLGFSGYEELLKEMRANAYEQPVYAIGGVKPEDLPGLQNAGVYGIAISSALFDEGHSAASIQRFTNQF